MSKCENCKKESILISKTIGFCVDCIRGNFDEVWPSIKETHSEIRRVFNLPTEPPKDISGTPCNICVNECRIPEGGVGYCGIRYKKEGKLHGGYPHDGNVTWYHDPLPTNCVGDWVCPGGTNSGYPEYSHCKGPEYGYKNLAVFYNSCSFNCLFCQNWHYREQTLSRRSVTAQELANSVDEYTSCICYFGGDPTPQLPHAIKASKLALEKRNGKILRICWETNGTMNKKYLKQMADLSLISGGCIKFDIKAWSECVNMALCGITNQRTIENFEYLATRINERPEPPFLIASTLLVPGYVDIQEVRNIARFIASLNKEVPYSLLAFHPNFYMNDLPTTSKKHAFECKRVAEDEGLKKR